MRSVGGAGIGLFACLLGCVSMPPPAAGPAPPTVAAPAQAAPASPPETAVEWDARAGTLRCRSAQITVPPELREQIRWTNTDELAVLPPGSPAGGALVVGMIEVNDDGDAPNFLEDATLTWLRLQLLAGGGLLGAVDMKLRGGTNFDDGRLVGEYTLGAGKGKAVYLRFGLCRIAALDFPLPSDHPPLTNLLAKLEALVPAGAD
ncbi:MAG TPA: hypothetical protein VIF57_08965 [Polyangia bacterium]|jgi:hypothetical protein